MKNILRKVRPYIGLALLVLALFLIRNLLKKYSYRELEQDLFRISAGGFFLSLGFTIISYLFLTFYDVLALHYIKHPLQYRKIVLSSFIGYVFGYNLTILGGGAARYRIYSSWGISALETAKVVIFSSLTFWLGFLTLSGIIFIFEPISIQKLLDLPFFATTLPVGVTFLVLVAAYVIVVGLRKKPLNIRGLELSALGPDITALQIVIACADWMLACAVLYFLLPSNPDLSFLRFLGIFLLAQFAGIVSQIPGGLGAFETVALYLLSVYYAAPSVLGSLLIYRVIYYLFPFVIAASLLGLLEMLKQKAVRIFGAALSQVTSIAVPHVFAFLVFLGGTVLLFSGALPAEQSRLELLRDFLPLPFLEVSHFMASLIGFWLLLLARGLQLRLDATYYLTSILLALGIFLSLFKGLDYEEATILFIMLVVFLPCRKEFYRKSSLFAHLLNFNWIIPIVIVVAGSIWLGFFSYKHVEYSNSLWWKFAYNSDASRFLRATAGITIVSMTLAVGTLLRFARKPLKKELAADLGTVRSIVENSSRTYANLALLGDKLLLISRSGSAFLMYGSKGQSWIAMGSPIGPTEEWSQLLWRFYEMADKHGCSAAFYEVSADDLPYYADLGLVSLKMGEEARVPLPDFSLQGGAHRHLRYTINALEKLGYEFKVLQASETKSLMGRLREISDAWLEHKNIGEMGFCVGFFDEEYISNYPIAVVFNKEGITAFANMWLGAEKEELSIDLMRYVPGSHDGLMDFLFAQLMVWAKQEGYRYFNLGMAPLSGIESGGPEPGIRDVSYKPRKWPILANFVYRHGEHFYNFQGLRKYKEKFGPQWIPKYLICPGGLAVPRVLGDIISLFQQKPVRKYSDKRANQLPTYSNA